MKRSKALRATVQSNDPHTGQEDAEYVCDICGRIFDSEGALEDHVHEEGQME